MTLCAKNHFSSLQQSVIDVTSVSCIMHHASHLSPHPLILDLLSTCPTVSSSLGSKLVSSPNLFLLSFSLTQDETNGSPTSSCLRSLWRVQLGKVRQISWLSSAL